MDTACFCHLKLGTACFATFAVAAAAAAAATPLRCRPAPVRHEHICLHGSRCVVGDEGGETGPPSPRRPARDRLQRLPVLQRPGPLAMRVGRGAWALGELGAKKQRPGLGRGALQNSGGAKFPDHIHRNSQGSSTVSTARTGI